MCVCSHQYFKIYRTGYKALVPSDHVRFMVKAILVRIKPLTLRMYEKCMFMHVYFFVLVHEHPVPINALKTKQTKKSCSARS